MAFAPMKFGTVRGAIDPGPRPTVINASDADTLALEEDPADAGHSGQLLDTNNATVSDDAKPV